MVNPTSTWLRSVREKHPEAKLPSQRKLIETCRDGAPWASQMENGRWVICDEAAAAAAFGLTSKASLAA